VRHLDLDLLADHASLLEQQAGLTPDPLRSALLRWKATSLRTAISEVRALQEGLSS
jgi:hypothetical protein